MTIKDCIDIVDNIKPNQYTIKDKVMWLSFIEQIIINEVLKTHEGYDGRYDDFEGYSENKLSVTLIVPSPYDILYQEYLKMMIDKENGEIARYNNSMTSYNAHMLEYRKHYNKTHMPLDKKNPRQVKPSVNNSVGLSDAEYEKLKTDMTYILTEYFSDAVSPDKLYDIVNSFAQNNIEMLKGKDGRDGIDGKDGYTPRKNIDYFDGKNGAKGDKGYTPQKRVDYWTEEDVAEIHSYVDKQADEIQSDLNKQIDSFSDENLIQVVDAVMNDDGTEDESQFFESGTGGNIYYVREIYREINTQNYTQGGYFLFKITDNPDASVEMMIKITEHSIATRHTIGQDEWSEWEVHPYSDENFTSVLKSKLNNLPTNEELEEKIEEKADVLKLTTNMSKVHKITDSAEKKIVGIEFYKKNLFNKNGNINEKFGWTTGSNTLLEDGTIKATSNWNDGRGKGQFIDVTPNTTYVYSFDILEYTEGGTQTALEIIDVSDGTTGSTLMAQNSIYIAKKKFSYSFTTGKTTTKIWISINGCKEINSGNYIIYDNIQLEKDKVVSTYEPYIDGDPTVTLYGKNLLDTRDIKKTAYGIKFTSNEDGSINISGTKIAGEGYVRIREDYNIVLKAGVTYTISKKGGTGREYAFFSTTGVYDPNTRICNVVTDSKPQTYTPTEDVTIKSLRVYIETDTVMDNEKENVYLQIEVDEKTGFEKYKDPQIAQGNDALNLTMNYPNTTIICDCGCKVTYKADSTNAYFNLLDRITALENAVVSNV